MKCTGVLAKAGAVILACLGMLLPTPVLQAAGTHVGSKQDADGRVPVVVDVALDEAGSLRGQVVDARGKPVVRTALSIRQLDREIATTLSDQSGYFLVTGLRGGMYRIVAGEATGAYRFWAPGTAPPSARPEVLMVLGDQQVLGQGRRWLQLLRNPWVVGGIVMAAAVIPIVIHNSRPESR